MRDSKSLLKHKLYEVNSKLSLSDCTKKTLDVTNILVFKVNVGEEKGEINVCVEVTKCLLDLTNVNRTKK